MLVTFAGDLKTGSPVVERSQEFSELPAGNRSPRPMFEKLCQRRAPGSDHFPLERPSFWFRLCKKNKALIDSIGSGFVLSSGHPFWGGFAGKLFDPQSSA